MCKRAIQQAKLARSDQQKVFITDFQMDIFRFLQVAHQGSNAPLQAAIALLLAELLQQHFVPAFSRGSCFLKLE